MRPWTITTRVLIPLGFLGLMAGCGGGSSNNGSSISPSSTVPVASIGTVSPADSPLSEFKLYTFSATATDSAIGRSVASFTWNFGDGSAPVTVKAASNACTTTHAFQKAGSFTVQVLATDDAGGQGAAVQATENVVTASSPVTVTVTRPSGATTLNVQIPGTVQYLFNVTAITTATGATVGAGNLTFSPGDAAANNPVVGTIVANGGGSFTIPVTYASTTLGSRTFTPTISATDSLGDNSALVDIGPITVTSTGINHPPTVTITTPASSPTNAFTSKAVTLAFSVADQDGDVVAYTVDWGDGSTASTGSTGTSALAGVSFTLTHAFPDTFPTGTTAKVTVTADDGRTPAPLPSASTSFLVTFNTYPTATITSPQASATIPTTAELKDNFLPGLRNPPTATSPDLVVIPAGGQLTFNGTATLPGSGDGPLAYSWAFPGGVPSSSNSATPGQVFFSGQLGAINAYLVTFTVTDTFSRVSSAATGVNAKTYQKWVIVDGTNTQYFDLAFLYRQKSDNNGTASLTPVTTAPNGYGATVQIFQDGSSNSWTVASANQATVNIPVRSNLPFYIEIPNFGLDTFSYMMRIPNAPTGPYEDPSLVTASPLAAGPVTYQEGFGFQTPSATATPWWNPTLQIVTAQGFAPEAQVADGRILKGTVGPGMVLGQIPVNSRWVDRLSVPLTDSLAVQWEQDSNYIAEFSGVDAYQSFAEWPMVPLTVASGSIDPKDVNSISQGKPGDMGFNVNYATYANSDTQTSQTYMTTELQAFRVPSGSTDPYNLGDLVGLGWNSLSCISALNPTDLDPAPATSTSRFFSNMIYGDKTTKTGGIQYVAIPYDPNDPDRVPFTPVQNRSFNDIRLIFSYSEYLWSTVWARPLVLNSAQLNYPDSMGGLLSFPYFRNSRPTAWPNYLAGNGITPDSSKFDLTASGGGTFNASSPVAVNSATAPSSKGVGRFYWTAFTPSYDAGSGAMISRTWLADPSSLPPTTFTAGGAGDAAADFGFIPPQDTMVDKRGRNADGSLSGAALGGYRVTWFNATVNTSGNPVPPDFWVIEMTTAASISSPGGSTVHFMLPGNFPYGSASDPVPTQSVNALVLTDARTFLPSGSSTLQPGDKVAPGYCWFDVPPELRPSSGPEGITATITVFGLKAVLRNHPVAGLARALNRTDWIDAIKTATARISVIPSSGKDLSYAHKIPFNYPWDIVVVNGPATTVAP